MANAHVRADQIKEDAQAEAQAMDVSARDQAKAQAQKLVDAAAAEANEIQNAHQLRLNNLRAEVREMEAQRAALIDYLGLMSRKLLNLQNEAIANDPAAEARAADNADRELETELPELHTVPTPEAPCVPLASVVYSFFKGLSAPKATRQSMPNISRRQRAFFLVFTAGTLPSTGVIAFMSKSGLEFAKAMA